jgi:glycosyltransferase involved in cell wall biosynthesis
MSFCIITAGHREEMLQTVIRSIQRQEIPEYEIIVVGRHREQPGLVYIPAEEAADAGRLSTMRNLGVALARHENIVLLDDDIVLAPDWYRSFCGYERDFDILTSQIRLPDGGRYWDHATAGGPLDHSLLREDEEDGQVYMTGGGGWVMRRAVARTVRWDENRGFYESEDVDFAQRCRERGFRISHNHRSIVFHADPSYTTVGRAVFRRTEGRSHRWIEGSLRALAPQDLGRQIGQHLRADQTAEAADGLRFAQRRYPEYSEFAHAWHQLEEVYGGPLPDVRWSSTDDPAYNEAIAYYADSPGCPTAIEGSGTRSASQSPSSRRGSASGFGVSRCATGRNRG